MADLKCVVKIVPIIRIVCAARVTSWWAASTPVTVTAPAVRALRRREREENLSAIPCLIQAIRSASTVRQ